MKDKHLYVRRASAGSGKTYTLAAHYVALLMHGESYASILAVTFTKKATAEMKERILGYLYAMAHHSTDSDTHNFVERVRAIYHELGYDSPILSDEYCRKRAKEVFEAILADYDSMRIQTIDSFLQTLLAGMVQKLDGAAGYQVEMDIQRVIDQAVDELLTEGAKDSAISRAINLYIDQRLDDETNWDIRAGLKDLAKELYKELLQEKQGQLIFDETRLRDLAKRLANWRRTHAQELQTLEQRLKRAERFVAADFNRGSQSYMPTFTRLRACLDEKLDERKDKKVYFTTFSDTTYQKIVDSDTFAKEYKGREDMMTVRQELLDLVEAARACRRAYLRSRYVGRFLNDMLLMGALQQSIHRLLELTNSRLLATTANTLARALEPGDADFILEKAGIRYRHIMLDEFQDTSTLQWVNFEKLLKEILSGYQGSTLIVGDIKQSIYRWRNGNWKIMAGLEEDWHSYYNPDTPALVCNFRSEQEIVRFNLDTFRYLSEQEGNDIALLYDEGYDGENNLNQYYRHGHEGGYVRVRLYSQYSDTKHSEERRRVRERMVADMFLTISQLLSHQQAKGSDIMILIRRNKEAEEILRVWESVREQTGYEPLKDTSLVSADCFCLRYSRAVNVLVQATRAIYLHDEGASEYVHLANPDADISQHEATYRTMALSDMTEALIRDILPPTLAEEEMAYLNSYRDYLRQYQQSNGSDGQGFLRYWDERLQDIAIPAVESGGIRMMTIHSSKGLQAPVVFLPFCNWKMEDDKPGSKLWCEVQEIHTHDGLPALLPIEQNSGMAEAGFEREYQAEHHDQRIDNLNLLYVAFTRAAERLYVYADVGKCSDKERTTRHVGQLLAERCGLLTELEQMIAEDHVAAETDYKDYIQGDASWQKSDNNKETSHTEPFSFAHTESEVGQCHSSATRIEFRQSQDSRKYGWDVASAQEQEESMDKRVLGITCHEILAALSTYDTAERAREAICRAIDEAYLSGTIVSEAMMDTIRPLLMQTVTHPSMQPFFVGPQRVLCEEAILLNEDGKIKERRMDRVLWREGEAIVLDYKFGADDPRYDSQVRKYMDICRRMGATRVHGYLWIAAEQRLVEVGD